MIANPSPPEHPILFTGPMIRAILEGRKTQTRRVILPQPDNPNTFGISPIWGSGVPKFSDDIRLRDKFCIHAAFNENGQRVDRWLPCPYGQPGDHLWVRETHSIVPATAYRASREENDDTIPHVVSPDGKDWAVFREGWTRSAPDWRPSIHMPRWASRLTLEVVNIRVERVRDISEQDAIAEGVEIATSPEDRVYRLTRGNPMWLGYGGALPCVSAQDSFSTLWDSINAKRGHSWESNCWVWVVEFKCL